MQFRIHRLVVSTAFLIEFRFDFWVWYFFHHSEA